VIGSACTTKGFITWGGVRETLKKGYNDCRSITQVRLQNLERKIFMWGFF
jgi:hypothetical protein